MYTQLDKQTRALLDNTLTRRFFVAPAFELYGGIAGLYDLGPLGAQLRGRLQALWRRHFVVADDLQELQCTCLVPEQVLVASGHVAKFADLMVKDARTGECYRADKVLEEQLGRMAAEAESGGDAARAAALRAAALQADGLGEKETRELIDQYNILSPNNNPLSGPFAFNLMFQTQVGPAGGQRAYLRPETAQGIFVNFKRAFDAARQRLPFGVAQIGTSFRNEIAPRNGLLRCREFEQMEIEWFYASRENAEVEGYEEVKNVKVNLLTADEQEKGGEKLLSVTIDQALSQNIITHKTLAYFVARTQQFLELAGLHPGGLRFRQHTRRQLAHYAADCWDADALLSAGWVELAGIADRSAYDLQVHSRGSGQDLSAFVKFDAPVEQELYVAKPALGKLPAELKRRAQEIKQKIEAMGQEELQRIDREIQEKGEYGLGDGLALPAATIQLQRKK